MYRNQKIARNIATVWNYTLFTVFRKKVVYFVFERNFTTTGSIFLQFSMTITK